eukprot:NODE_108_length_18904_cov_0.654826.p7 type:complete len:347 gc:universal NODE_108_length_18904_cov_0.654826:5898-4858(-)
MLWINLITARSTRQAPEVELDKSQVNNEIKMEIPPGNQTFSPLLAVILNTDIDTDIHWTPVPAYPDETKEEHFDAEFTQSFKDLAKKLDDDLRLNLEEEVDNIHSLFPVVIGAGEKAYESGSVVKFEQYLDSLRDWYKRFTNEHSEQFMENVTNFFKADPSISFYMKNVAKSIEMYKYFNAKTHLLQTGIEVHESKSFSFYVAPFTVEIPKLTFEKLYLKMEEYEKHLLEQYKGRLTQFKSYITARLARVAFASSRRRIIINVQHISNFLISHFHDNSLKDFSDELFGTKQSLWGYTKNFFKKLGRDKTLEKHIDSSDALGLGNAPGKKSFVDDEDSDDTSSVEEE